MVRLVKSPLNRKHLEVNAFVDATQRCYVATVGASNESRSYRRYVLDFFSPSSRRKTRRFRRASGSWFYPSLPDGHEGLTELYFVDGSESVAGIGFVDELAVYEES